MGMQDDGRSAAMRKVILQELVTVDGLAAGPNGELDFFDVVTDYSEVDRDNLEMLKRVDTILLGDRTHRTFVEYWPTAEGEPVAESVNSMSKIVFSSTLDHAPWGSWDDAHLVRGGAADHVAAQKQRPGKDLIVWGSLSLAHSLLNANIIDEIDLLVCPIVLGRARPPAISWRHGPAQGGAHRGQAV
jgi:dihydrofolate reductase